MRLLTAMDQMTATLIEADASDRQLTGVTQWRDCIAGAVVIGSRYPHAAGMTIPTWHPRTERPHHQARFLARHVTHAAWRDLCEAIITALSQQEADARTLVEEWAARAAAAPTTGIHSHAAAQARYAHTWLDAAAEAQKTGRHLIADEDAIHVPVGLVIARMGALDVAADKHYHQRETRR